MSGAEDLARLTGTIDILNEITISPEIKDVDVGNGETRPTVTKALSIAATQFGGAMPYTSIEEALTNTITGTVFSVPSALATPSDPLKYIDMYLNDGGVAVPLGDYPSGDALRAMSALVQGVPTLPVASEEAALALADEEGGEFLLITPKITRTPAVDAETVDLDSGIYDAEGGALIHADADGMSIGALMIGNTDLDGIYVTDQEGSIFQRLDDPGEAPGSLSPVVIDPLAGGVYFAPKVVTAPGASLHLDVSSMIAPREDSIGVVASISSNTTSESQSSDRTLVVQASKFGGTGRLKLRNPDNALTQHIMDLSFVEIPAGPFSGAEPNVLVIGDSISNRQGAQFLKDVLATHGYSANFIGTMAGSAIPDGPTNVDGPLGECREVYSTGNYTYASVSEITIPIEPGMEAEYLAMTKTPKRNHNPFIRAATGEDDPAIIRNGYVLDFAFYQSRFSLPPPDIIVYALGMNEFLQASTGEELFNYVLDNESLMLQRIRAAWPSVKVLRCLPGLPYNRTRNPQWTDRYIPMIRGVMSTLNALGDSRNILVPSWTFTNPETGYATSSPVADPITGVSAVEITDMTHPVGANRRGLFQGIAPYIAAAALNLI